MSNFNQYYVVKFRFNGKKSCVAFSADFVIEKYTGWFDVQGKAENVARAKLQELFGDIFPDDALPFLINPETVLAIPGQIILKEQTNDH